MNGEPLPKTGEGKPRGGEEISCNFLLEQFAEGAEAGLAEGPKVYEEGGIGEVGLAGDGAFACLL
jgi:hypothetical protein